jgi:hypothetical protein
MAETQTGRLPKLGARINAAAEQRNPGSKTSFRCQWCMVDLDAGVEVCPTCGSPGINALMVVPGAAAAIKPDEVALAPTPETELKEWWNEGDEESTYRNSAAEERDLTPIIIGLLGTVVVCILIGILVAPMALASVFESSLGVTVENSNDLRPLGGILGLLVGAFIGAIGMWVTTPRR